MKFMLNGATTRNDGWRQAEICWKEVGQRMHLPGSWTFDEVINYENNGGFTIQMDIYNSDADIKRIANKLCDVHIFPQGDKEMYRDLYNSLLTAQRWKQS